MNDLDIRIRTHGTTMSMPRSRGAVTGFVLILLGLWGALIPFVGPYLDFAFSPERAWTWTAARGWLQVLPGMVTVAGGLLLAFSGNRAIATLGAWLSAVAGAWFVAGRAVAAPLELGSAGTPATANDTKAAWLELTYFSGLGALIIFLAALCMGRLSVRSLRDIRHAEAPVALVDKHSSPTAEPFHGSVEPAAASPTPGDDTAPRDGGLFDRFRRRPTPSAR